MRLTFRQTKFRSPLIRVLAFLPLFSAVVVVAQQMTETQAKSQTPPTATRSPSPTPTTQPSAATDPNEPRREPTAAEILKEITQRRGAAPRPVVIPVTPGTTKTPAVLDTASLPPNAVSPLVAKLFEDGHRIVDRPGRLTREGDYYIFAFESRGQGNVEPPLRLLPNRLLEDMEIVSAGGTKPAVFIVSGELTAYHGVNYLLVQKLLIRPEVGNLR